MPRDHRVFVFDHISIGVADLDVAVAFYDACLGALGLVRLWHQPRAAAYGPAGYEAEAPFALVVSAPDAPAPREAAHIAFVAPSREAVQRFHAAALAHGGRDEGAPRIREHYDPGYYAAFVRDPDGHRVEAVCHES
jgi:catechol 2,3-dioxygenase-like lactoylglutathione lyase family enzyme